MSTSDSNSNLSDSSEKDRIILEAIAYEQSLIQKEIDALQKNKKRRYIERNREAGNTQLVNDYFSPQPLYPDHLFRRRFRMNRNLFIRIVNALENHSTYFRNSHDATGRVSLTPLQKCTAAIRQLAYGVPADHLDEYLRMGETTAIKCMFKFCECIIELLAAQYLRRPNHDDTQRLVQMQEERHGFTGMLGSLDCMHWEWKNCPTAWEGQFCRGHGKTTIVLEAVASRDLWNWHAFFGAAGSRNYLNELYESPLFNNVLSGNAPLCNFEVNGTQYSKGYYLTDGIYPNRSTFVKKHSCPLDTKRKKFKEMQKRLQGKMLNAHLECYRQDGQLSKVLPDFGTETT